MVSSVDSASSALQRAQKSPGSPYRPNGDNITEGGAMQAREHWENVYETKAPDAVSWYRPHLETSFALIERVCPERKCSVIDVGGGEATLVDDLVKAGYRDITVLDLSEKALQVARERLSDSAAAVTW